MKPIKKVVWLLILLGIIYFVIRFFWTSQLSAVSDDPQVQSFIISKGESFSEVAKRLAKEKLIKSSWAFTVYGKKSDLADKIQAGTFEISQSMTSAEILKALTSSPQDAWVTIIEGWRVEEIAEKLNSQLGTDKKEFLKIAKEGYMFPDTYLIPKEYNVSQIAQVMRDNFEKKFTPELRAKIKSKGLSESQGVILASIVEREGRSQEVRRMIASILLKRLNIGMGLFTDATVQYALIKKGAEKAPEGGWWKRSLTRDDLRIDSPFNTYIYAGLPPAPISNPSLSSLTAVADADSKLEYLYYFHDSEGNSHYGRTLQEHNENIANFR
jgi:UPF0755 protein